MMVRQRRSRTGRMQPRACTCPRRCLPLTTVAATQAVGDVERSAVSAGTAAGADQRRMDARVQRGTSRSAPGTARGSPRANRNRALLGILAAGNLLRCVRSCALAPGATWRRTRGCSLQYRRRWTMRNQRVRRQVSVQLLASGHCYSEWRIPTAMPPPSATQRGRRGRRAEDPEYRVGMRFLAGRWACC